MLVRSHLATLVVALTLVSCGSETSREESFSASSSNKTNKRSSGDAKAEPKDDFSDSESTLDCDGVNLHGNHLTCDSDDLEVITQPKDETTETKPKNEDEETPAKEPDSDISNGSEDPVIIPNDPVSPDPVKDPNIVEFRIKAGTGSGGWNTQAEMINAKVGQTIRVFNDDTIVHRLHTSNNAPCAHGVNIPVGGSRDCVVGRAFDSTNSNAVYDHIVGPSAKIWIKAQ
jgi:hypothetical protein